MPQHFTESDLTFAFPDDWVVRKFDDTSAYQSLSGHGLKGVDFIALSPDEKLWLIEVKNYRPRIKDTKEYRATRRSPDTLAEHVATKFTDTYRLLRIVNKSLTGKWWFDLWKFFRQLLPSPDSNYWFWTEAYRRSQNSTHLICVLWMETPETNDDYDMAVLRALEKLIPAGARVEVVEEERKGDVEFGTVWSELVGYSAGRL